MDQFNLDEQEQVQDSIADAIASVRAAGHTRATPEAISEFATSLMNEMWTHDLVMIKEGKSHEQLKLDSSVAQALHNSDVIITSTPGDVPDTPLPNPEIQPIDPELIAKVLEPLLSYPSHLTTPEFEQALNIAKESDEKHNKREAVGRSRVLADQAIITALTEKLAVPNQEMRSRLEEKKAQLAARKADIAAKKAAVVETSLEQFKNRKKRNLEFHYEWDKLRSTNEEKAEKIRRIQSEIRDVKRLLTRDQKEQDRYLSEGHDMLRSHARNRLHMYARLQDEVIPALLHDAKVMKDVIDVISEKNVNTVAAARHKLVVKQEEINNKLSLQMARMKSLTYTLDVLKRENEQVSAVRVAQQLQHNEGAARLRKLQTGFALRKYHSHTPGKSVMRWLQLSDDATYLFYATDQHLKKKFKKYRVSEVSDLMIGPCSSTFARAKLHKHDLPTRLFSILFKDHTTLDFAVPPTKEILTPPEYSDLAANAQKMYTLNANKMYERDITFESMETLLLGLHDITAPYDTQAIPVFTSEKLRWMRVLIGSQFGNMKELDESTLSFRRQHLRRIFGYQYFESHFEAIQSKGETGMLKVNEITADDLKSVDIQSQQVSEKEDDKLDKSGDVIAEHTPRGDGVQFVSDYLRSQFKSRSSFSYSKGAASSWVDKDSITPQSSPERTVESKTKSKKPDTNLDLNLTSGDHEISSILSPAAVKVAKLGFADMLEIIQKYPTEDGRFTAIIRALSTSQYNFSCAEGVQLLSHFSMHKKDVAIKMHRSQSLSDPFNFESVIQKEAFQAFEPVVQHEDGSLTPRLPTR